MRVVCRWDRDPLARAVTKLVSNDRKETMASAPTLQKALTLMTDQEAAQHVHPNHIMIPLNSETKSVLGDSPASLHLSLLSWRCESIIMTVWTRPSCHQTAWMSGLGSSAEHLLRWAPTCMQTWGQGPQARRL